MFCHYCGMLGHDLKHCATHFALEKNGGEVEYQYANWLKATVDHPRFPLRQYLGKGFNSTNDMGDILEQTTNHQPKFGKLMATRKSDTETLV